ncbi:hypothetical protein AHEV_110 [Adoxophyes honmai entomopoxvirus 'L']|uniref:N1R/p28-like protein n=1 Tax=Adoxophyes honmai entomopoxvirus 'L' TaxID=1293540 RepID=A0A916KP21_9POXV|nr:hypothetical protein AHEV_110 [Adoxophyes honmai entomopoxvirus 'L']CCU55431.1 hypothetical protein AHEV_110 [Adoxophyes honmai entomopoxvirus 'L']
MRVLQYKNQIIKKCNNKYNVRDILIILNITDVYLDLYTNTYYPFKTLSKIFNTSPLEIELMRF